MRKVYVLLITTAAYWTRGLSGLAETELSYRWKASFMRASRGGWLCSVKASAEQVQRYIDRAVA